MSQFYNPNAPKRATNLSINSDLLEKARGLNINLSATLEAALADHLRAALQAGWKQENAQALQAYNDYVEGQGVFSDRLRKF